MTMDRRQHTRNQLEPPYIGILHTEGADYVDGTTLVDHPQSFFVDLLNKSPGGAALKSTIEVEPGTPFRLSLYNPDGKAWDHYEGYAVWIEPENSEGETIFLIGVSLQSCSIEASNWPIESPGDKKLPLEGTYEFFKRTELLRSLPREAVVPLLNCVFHRYVKAGERFITQGEPGDACYLIQSGVCVARVEKEGRFKTVARLREGSILGEMALLTGESRSAHVFAETDMDLWGLTRTQYDHLYMRYPELRAFLTNILTRWYDSRKVIADRHVGKYIISDVIGQGAYAIVYKGRHQDLNMPVAIKMLRHDMAMEPDFINGFRDEAKTIAKFGHENIVKIYDIEERYRTVFIVMEYLEGRTLRQVLDVMLRLSPVKVLQYVLQICKGLQYAHRQDIVHQDIKPANIFILPNDTVKIVDFGLSCTCGTETMMTGTPFYMSPEQVECLPLDIRADIYALGIMTYEMVTGQRPFPEKDAWTVMHMHVTDDIPDPADVVTDTTEPLRKMILKACARDPQKRYQSVEEIMEDLYPLAETFDLNLPSIAPQRNSMTTVHILHKDEHQKRLDLLIRKFSKELEEEGMKLKFSDF